jgi:DNA-binding MarR family transcriptional regulator
LRRAYHVAKANTQAGLNDLGITPMQASAVMAIHRAGRLSQAELGRAIGMPPANVHGLVARMVALKLVTTTAHPTDQRQLLVTLARAGTRRAEEIARVTAASADRTLEPLSANERATLLELLRRVAAGE